MYVSSHDAATGNVLYSLFVEHGEVCGRGAFSAESKDTSW